MISIRVTHTIDEDFILHMLSLWIDSNPTSKSYSSFKSYLVCQVEMFGSCFDSQFGENPIGITEETRKYYARWYK